MPLSEGDCTCTLGTPRTTPGPSDLVARPVRSGFFRGGAGRTVRKRHRRYCPTWHPCAPAVPSCPQLGAWHMRGRAVRPSLLSHTAIMAAAGHGRAHVERARRRSCEMTCVGGRAWDAPGGDATTGNKAAASYATWVFQRTQLDSPMACLPGLDKPSVAVRSSPPPDAPRQMQQQQQQQQQPTTTSVTTTVTNEPSQHAEGAQAAPGRAAWC